MAYLEFKGIGDFLNLFLLLSKQGSVFTASFSFLFLSLFLIYDDFPLSGQVDGALSVRWLIGQCRCLEACCGTASAACGHRL